jgi:uncharacterized membrane protein YvbJ
VICTNCGTENRVGARFCMECATPFAASCPSCGAANLPAAKFCSECATPIGGGPPRAAATPGSFHPTEREMADGGAIIEAARETLARLGAQPFLAHLEAARPGVVAQGPRGEA